jgi:hypothetical protein
MPTRAIRPTELMEMLNNLQILAELVQRSRRETLPMA